MALPPDSPSEEGGRGGGWLMAAANAQESCNCKGLRESDSQGAASRYISTLTRSWLYHESHCFLF